MANTEYNEAALLPGITRPATDLDDAPAAPAPRSGARLHVVPTHARHPALTIAMHWGTLAAILIAVGAMWVRDVVEDNTLRQVLLQAHRQLGIAVLLVAVARIVVRLRYGFADHAQGMAAVLRWAAKGAHLALYGVLLAIPLVGWALTNAHGINLNFLGVIPLPAITAADSEFADTLNDYHVWLAWGLLALVGAHALAALWHHYVRRDAVLRAMLPARAARTQRTRLRDAGRQPG